MVKIPGGTFWIGTADEEIERLRQKYDTDWFKHKKTRHPVTVPHFWMGKYLVTQAQWQAVMANNPARYQGRNRPVEQVTWHESIEFCQKLSEKTKVEFRLPSEAEWEYACRAGTTTPLSCGKTLTTDFANCDGNQTYAAELKGVYRGETTEVGTFPVNAFGLYDMHGNVWEWCADDWHSNYEDAPTDGKAWTKGTSSRVRRGGSWDDFPWDCRSASRDLYKPGIRLTDFGFRVVCPL